MHACTYEYGHVCKYVSVYGYALKMVVLMHSMYGDLCLDIPMHGHQCMEIYVCMPGV